MDSISSGISSASSGFTSKVSAAMGGGKLASAVAKIGGGIGANAATNLVNKYIPPKSRSALNLGAGALGDVMRGDFEGAGLRMLDSGLLDKFIPGMGGVSSQSKYWGAPTPLMGGVSPMEAKQIHESLKGQGLARKNLWLIEVSSPLRNDVSQRFNMFATELDYSPLTISGEKRKVGAASVDTVQSSDPIELRLTTMDDKSGFVKQWFEEHCSAAAAANGTVGVPGKYAIKIKVVHGFITQGSNRGGYQNIGLFRPANLEVSLSRREDGLQEVQMTFSQLDTFMKP